MERLASPARVRCICLLTGLLWCTTLISPCGAAEPTETAVTSAPAALLLAARWERSGLQVEVSAASDATVSAETFPALAHYAVGVAAVPITLLEPAAALGLPFYILLAAPWQASFNAQRATLVNAFTTQPLTQATAEALRSQWPPQTPQAGTKIQLRIESYGLQTRSGRALAAFDERKEDLCLTARTHLEMTRQGRPLYQALLAIALQPGADGEPPALCAPLSRWASHDAALLRQGILELAEVLAALTLKRWKAAP